jgi:putative peptide zinc metalloprotease protein
VGVGLYIIWFVLFCDVTDSYRLDKVGRLRTDCGGLYFDAIFTLAIVGAYFLTGFEPLLALALLNQLAALDELSPFVRFDGYYIVSDLTGVPNLFQYIPPVIKGLIPGREADESVKALKPWVRAVITVWVLATVPVLLFGLVMLFYLGPWVLANAWESFLIQYGKVLGALEDGSITAGAKGVINILALLGPVVGGILIAAVVGRRLIVGAWRLSREGGRRLSLMWAPGRGGAGGPTAEHRGEGATTWQGWSAPRSRYAVYVAGVLVAAVGLGIGAFFVTGGQPEQNRAGGGPPGYETPEDTVTKPDDDAGSTNPEEPAEGVPFVHRATDENSRGNYTYVGGSAIDGDPNAVVMVFAGREGAGSATYGHNIGAYYDPGAQRWAIFNQDRSAVPAGAAFRVGVPPASDSFVHRAELVNTVGNATYLNDPLTDGKADARVSVTQNWNPGGGAGVYNDHPVGVFYDEDVQKWAVYNRDGAPMPEGAAFNVAVSGSDESAS